MILSKMSVSDAGKSKHDVGASFVTFRVPRELDRAVRQRVYAQEPRDRSFPGSWDTTPFARG